MTFRTEPHARSRQHVQRRLPGGVDISGGHLRQLRHPPPHVVTVDIKFFALQHRRKNPKVRRRIRSTARAPLPAERVAREVRVDERVPKPRGPVRPRQTEVLHQKRRDHHPHPVVHPAGVPELAHPRIDDRVARLPPLPRPQLDPAGVLGPRKLLEIRPQRSLRRMGKMIQQVVRKLPPADFAEKHSRAIARRKNAGVFRLRRNRRPHLSRRNFATMEPRREHRSAVAVREIPRLRIVLHRARRKLRQSLRRTRFARLPERRESRVPSALRQQLQLRDFQRPQLLRGRSQALRSEFHRCFYGQREAVSPIGRKHLKRSARLVRNRVRLVEQRAIETLHVESSAEELRLDRGIPRDQRRLVATIPIQGTCAGFSHQIPQLLDRIAPRDHQPRPEPPQRCIQGH